MPLSPAAKLLWYTMRLELGLSGIGVMYAAQLPEPTRLTAFDVDAGLQELVETQWLVRERNVMWLRNALRFDPYVNMKGRVHVQSVVNHLGGLPRLKIVSDFCAYYGIDPTWLDVGVPEKFTPAPKERLYHWVSATPTVTPTPTPPLQELGVRSEELGEVSGATHPPRVVPQKEKQADPDDPAAWMHDVWQEVLGSGRPLTLTTGRRQKYRAMYHEQLESTENPEQAWRAILWAVTRSEHHMKERAYQMPESLLRSEERRGQWVERALAAAQQTDERNSRVTAITDYLKRHRA